jgi:hypothetical protein
MLSLLRVVYYVIFNVAVIAVLSVHLVHSDALQDANTYNGAPDETGTSTRHTEIYAMVYRIDACSIEDVNGL